MVVIVPHVPIIPQAPPSPEAQELGRKIAELVRILRQENPKIGPQDVRQGLSLAEQNLRPEIGGGSGAKILLLVALLVGALILGVFVATSQGPAPSMRWIIIAIGTLAVVAAGLAVMRR